ncbi:hypothetical protein O5O45_05845 [Hahella aquimaris]|uniref:hypothetical protein n=1 Tax=Hahella sp. HNIBRBA332 TaxID=3015983 RepID=UPI00273ADC5B|nr:hypothetical protein [Hahella sp. HNIBRBA332]WLQ15441.1 hypothetical protein O5O45_05845 [Hahella sp. HNIBRBA332]
MESNWEMTLVLMCVGLFIVLAFITPFFISSWKWLGALVLVLGGLLFMLGVEFMYREYMDTEVRDYGTLGMLVPMVIAVTVGPIFAGGLVKLLYLAIKADISSSNGEA